MSGVDVQNKSEALNRVVASRVRILDAAEKTRRGARACVQSLPVSLPVIKMGVATLGGLAAAFVVAKRMSSKKPSKKKAVEGTTATAGAVALQALSAIVIPLIQRRMMESSVNESSQIEEAKGNISSDKTSLSALFYRWLGL